MWPPMNCGVERIASDSPGNRWTSSCCCWSAGRNWCHTMTSRSGCGARTYSPTLRPASGRPFSRSGGRCATRRVATISLRRCRARAIALSRRSKSWLSRLPRRRLPYWLLRAFFGRRRHNLPAELTSFVGRRKELLELRGVFASSRLLSLTGAGGVGKTRLAIRLARDLLNEFSDGVWLVDLAPLSVPDLVTQTIATALGIREEPQRSARDALVDGCAIVNSCSCWIPAST